MATNYGAPRRQGEKLYEDSLKQLKVRRPEHQSAEVEEGEIEAVEGFELPGTDLPNIELSIGVVPA